MSHRIYAIILFYAMVTSSVARENNVVAVNAPRRFNALTRVPRINGMVVLVCVNVNLVVLQIKSVILPQVNVNARVLV